MKRIIIFTYIALYAICGFSQDVTISGIEYNVISSSEVEVDGFNNIYGDIIIPEYINIDKKRRKVYKVTSIGSYAFRDCTSLSSIIIPNSITKIKQGTFKNCTSLSSITIPNSVTEIGDRAFEGCSSLHNITIPNSVTKIGDRIFADCASLTSIIIPNTVKEIPAGVFSGCTAIVSFTLPNSITEIGSRAFEKCIALTNITIPNSVIKIDDNAFSGCKRLTNITLPNSLKSVGKTILNHCENLHSIIVPNSKPDKWESLGLVDLQKLENIVDHNDKNPDWFIEDIRINFEKYEICWLYWPEKKEKILDDISKEELEQWREYILKLDYTALIDGRIAKLPPADIYTKYVNTKIGQELDEWQKKGEFESTAKWKERVNDTTRNKKINKAIEKYKRVYKDIVQEFYATKEKNRKNKFNPEQLVLSTYDADNETFLIKSRNEVVADILLPVRVEFAQDFKANWEKIKMTASLKYVPNGNDVALTSISFSDGSNTYTYDNNTQAKYSVTEIDYNFRPIEVGINNWAQGETSQQDLDKRPNNAVEVKKLSAGNLADVDINIPTNSSNNANTFAVIIGNEDYQQVAKVPYALNDAKIFAAYCEKTLGLPQKNIRTYKNATFGIMLSALADAKAIAEAYNGGINIIFYYAGHGVPNEKDNSAYLLPIDADGKQIEACFSVSRLYSELNSLKANSVTVFMDACFSGAQRGEGMLASARGVAIKAKNAAPQGNMVVFSAASGDETAYPYKEKGHGLFTYFLLKKLNETKGDVTLGELGDYITSNVKQQSVVVNRKSQTPTVTVSQLVSDSWRNSKLR